MTVEFTNNFKLIAYNIIVLEDWLQGDYIIILYSVEIFFLLIILLILWLFTNLSVFGRCFLKFAALFFIVSLWTVSTQLTTL